MAIYVLTDVRVAINAVVLSDHGAKVTLNAKAEVKESTAFGGVWKTKLVGLRDWTASVEFNQDHAASNVDATLWPIFSAGSIVTVLFRPTTAAISATNPEWQGSALIAEYTPIDGSVGDLAMAPISLEGSGILTRAVA